MIRLGVSFSLTTASLILAGWACAASVSAQLLQDYRCKIDRVATAEANPSRGSTTIRNSYIGREFTVERRTGLMAGALKNAYVTKPDVIDVGSDRNSFKAVTTMRLQQGAGYGTNVYVLVVDEFVRSTNKPFVFLENDDLYFGICVHF
ncbi:hypothetical protein [Caenimonas sp. SL110]|uniref:hypothetical protein n=1 Tax=Caenimonas sp. SL110 TaxID=1450524 RepID=UPI00128AE7CD|nr:hypothetical protein [Caenimonas sp. SL110]